MARNNIARLNLRVRFKATPNHGDGKPCVFNVGWRETLRNAVGQEPRFSERVLGMTRQAIDEQVAMAMAEGPMDTPFLRSKSFSPQWGDQ